MSTEASFQGYAPIVTIRPVEREIYRQLWERDEYRKWSPGEECVQEFLRLAQPQKRASLLDLGCGTGRAALALALVGGLDVTMLDFAANCLDADIRPMLETQADALRFVEADLSKPLPCNAVYGFCTDVLEHIPPSQVDSVLDNCLRACQHVYFQIATAPDTYGSLVGHPLHLSLHNYAWWLQRFNERDCVIHYSHEDRTHCTFYVTAWQPGRAIVDIGILNISDEQIKENVRRNIAQGWRQVEPHLTNDVEVAIIGGGPSLAQYEADIRKKYEKGVKIVTMNGAYNWCMDRGIGPVTQVIVDARPFNARFVHPVSDANMYLIASQCDPSVLEGLPRERAYLWHTTTDVISDILNEQYEVWWGVPGGSTVLLRAIPLLRMLGFKRFHLYGCDSCLTDDAHHAYAQPENPEELVIPVSVGKRVFHCHSWMVAQAQEFIDLIRLFGHEVQLKVYGDGLLNHILTTGAEMEV